MYTWTVLKNLLNVPYDRPLKMQKRVNKTILPKTKMEGFFSYFTCILTARAQSAVKVLFQQHWVL